MQQIKQMLQRWGKTVVICLLLFLAFAAGNSTEFSKTTRSQTAVLSANMHVSPTPTPTNVPTNAPITIINNIIVPTAIPTVSQTVAPTPTPIVIVITPTPTPIVQPTEEQTPTPTVLPTPIPQTATIAIDYAGAHAASTYTTPIVANETAWQAVQNAVGLTNIHDTDYGGSLGIFITGFNGIDASSIQYFDFQVNGVSSSVGVSSYGVQNGDILKFVLTNE